VNNLKQEQEMRRARHWDPKLRWQVIQDTISWAEVQATCRINTRVSRLRDQARKLRSW
jgi:hypothetical protein